MISKVFSGKVQHLFLFDWKAAYGLVYKYATSIAVQADAWAGRPPVRPPVCSGGGGGGGSDDPPRHMN